MPQLARGPVCQPCHVLALRSGVWKLVRYCDPWSAQPAADQWELYNLGVDPYEQTNLVTATEPTPTQTATAAAFLGMDPAALTGVIAGLRAEQARLEAELLSPYPSAHPSALLT
jgi:arylsulfatase A-like enzyme